MAMTGSRPGYMWSGTEWVPFAGGNSGGVPLGTVVAWAGDLAAVPVGWLLCDGSPVPASAALKSMLTNTPDLRARFVLGADPTETQAQGQVTVGLAGGSPTITVANLPEHTHVVGVGGTPASWQRVAPGTGVFVDLGGGAGYHENFDPASGHNIEALKVGGNVPYWPRYYALAYIIRSELVAADVADLSALDARYSGVAHNHDESYLPKTALWREAWRGGWDELVAGGLTPTSGIHAHNIPSIENLPTFGTSGSFWLVTMELRHSGNLEIGLGITDSNFDISYPVLSALPAGWSGRRCFRNTQMVRLGAGVSRMQANVQSLDGVDIYSPCGLRAVFIGLA